MSSSGGLRNNRVLSYKETDTDLVESVQNSFTRKLRRCFSVDYGLIPRGQQCSVRFGLLSLENGRKISDLVTMYKTHPCKVPIDPIIFFGDVLTGIVRRKLKLRVPAAKS